MMKLYGIDRYIGEWVSETGSRIHIRKVSEIEARVDYFDSAGKPLNRPFLKNSPSLDMIAHYDDYHGEFDVEVWGKGKGLVLHLLYEDSYILDSHDREALVPTIGRYEKDYFLEEFCGRVSLNHLVRASKAEQTSDGNAEKPPGVEREP